MLLNLLMIINSLYLRKGAKESYICHLQLGYIDLGHIDFNKIHDLVKIKI